MRTIAWRIAALLGKEHIQPEISGRYRVGDVRHCFADITLARKVLGYEPQVAMDDGLLKSFGDEAIGVISSSPYTVDLDTPSNQHFVADTVRDYGGVPGSYAAGLYCNGMVAEAALERINAPGSERSSWRPTHQPEPCSTW